MKILVVGAGLSGSVIARQLAEAGHKIHIIDERNHVGGNCYDEINDVGIRTHKYGPHLFHTNNHQVFTWLSKYTEWIDYKHKVKAQLSDGTLVTLPVNRETKHIVGEENILDIFFRPYTKKMWGMELEELNPDIINRVPIRNDMNENYFPEDKFQAMPSEGYTKMISNILDHPNINISLNVTFKHEMEGKYDHIFNSMPIDVYYNQCFGPLNYRSIKFEEITLPINKVLPVATVNFTHDGPKTRVTEWKNIPKHGDNPYFTTLTFEEPCDYTENDEKRFYPVKDKGGKNRKLYDLYKKLADSNKKLTFIGRLGLYVYFDMHQAVNSALKISENFIKKNK